VSRRTFAIGDLVQHPSAPNCTGTVTDVELTTAGAVNWLWVQWPPEIGAAEPVQCRPWGGLHVVGPVPVPAGQPFRIDDRVYLKKKPLLAGTVTGADPDRRDQLRVLLDGPPPAPVSLAPAALAHLESARGANQPTHRQRVV
jgi:hypothetical protein